MCTLFHWYGWNNIIVNIVVVFVDLCLGTQYKCISISLSWEVKEHWQIGTATPKQTFSMMKIPSRGVDSARITEMPYYNDWNGITVLPNLNTQFSIFFLCSSLLAGSKSICADVCLRASSGSRVPITIIGIFDTWYLIRSRITFALICKRPIFFGCRF